MNIYIVVLEHYDQSTIIGVDADPQVAIDFANEAMSQPKVNKFNKSSVCAVYEWQMGERFAIKEPVYTAEIKPEKPKFVIPEADSEEWRKEKERIELFRLGWQRRNMRILDAAGCPMWLSKWRCKPLVGWGGLLVALTEGDE
jgi:hypothetical protein